MWLNKRVNMNVENPADRSQTVACQLAGLSCHGVAMHAYLHPNMVLPSPQYYDITDQ